MGTEQQHDRVCEMGKFITPQQYFCLPKNIKHYLEVEIERVDKRITKIDDDLEKLKSGVCNVFKCVSCQIWENIQYFENKPFEESLVSLFQSIYFLF